MKRLFLLALMLTASLPPIARAEDNDRDRDDDRHHKISATELGVAGAGFGALIGIAGYLALRRRKTV